MREVVAVALIWWLAASALTVLLYAGYHLGAAVWQWLAETLSPEDPQ